MVSNTLKRVTALYAMQMATSFQCFCSTHLMCCRVTKVVLADAAAWERAKVTHYTIQECIIGTVTVPVIMTGQQPWQCSHMMTS